MRDVRNNIHVAGSALLPRNSERFIRRFMLRSLECILTEDIPRLHHTYASFRTMIAQHKWQVADFCRVETIREELDEYLRELEAGSRAPSPAVEAARRSNIYPKLGARVAFYVTGTHADVRLAEACTLAGDWDPNYPNENSSYYSQRLDDAAARFREFFEPRDFETIFTLDDLFGFSAKGISVVQRTLTPGGSASEQDADEGEGPGIWLADQP
jgi:hypothetical protein